MKISLLLNQFKNIQKYNDVTDRRAKENVLMIRNFTKVEKNLIDDVNTKPKEKYAKNLRRGKKFINKFNRITSLGICIHTDFNLKKSKRQ